MSFFTSRNNMRSAQPNRRLVPPPPMRRPMPKPQMSRPIQPVRPPTGLPQQISAPTGLPNINQPPLGLPNQMLPPIGLPNINQPPIGLPNINQQPTGLPPTQTQMPTPPAVPPVEQSNSMFAPPQQAMPIQQPAIAPVFQQTQQPVAPQQTQPMQQPNPFANEPGRDSNGMLIPGYGEPPPGTFLSQPVDKPMMQQPAQQNQRDPQYIGMPDEMYASMIKDKQMNNGQGPMDMMVRPWMQWNSQQQVAGPVEPNYQYNSDKTMRSIRGITGENTPYSQSQTYDPITGQWGQPGGEGGKFMPGLSIGY